MAKKNMYIDQTNIFKRRSNKVSQPRLMNQTTNWSNHHYDNFLQKANYKNKPNNHTKQTCYSITKHPSPYKTTKITTYKTTNIAHDSNTTYTQSVTYKYELANNKPFAQQNYYYPLNQRTQVYRYPRTNYIPQRNYAYHPFNHEIRNYKGNANMSNWYNQPSYNNIYPFNQRKQVNRYPRTNYVSQWNYAYPPFNHDVRSYDENPDMYDQYDPGYNDIYPDDQRVQVNRFPRSDYIPQRNCAYHPFNHEVRTYNEDADMYDQYDEPSYNGIYPSNQVAYNEDTDMYDQYDQPGYNDIYPGDQRAQVNRYPRSDYIPQRNCAYHPFNHEVRTYNGNADMYDQYDEPCYIDIYPGYYINW